MAVARWWRGRTKLAARRAGFVQVPDKGKSQRPVLRLKVRDRDGHQPSRELAGVTPRGGPPRRGAGSRMLVSLCTHLLVKRVKKMQNWVVAVKYLVILHRSMLDGGFLFQDQLTYSSIREGKEHLTYSLKSNQASEFSLWVSSYAQYLDERLRCAHAVKNHLDHRWKGEIKQNQVEYMWSEELLYQLKSLQNLLQELYQCDPGVDAGEHQVIQGALVLVVMDGLMVVSEIRFRIQEMLGRADVMALSESLAVLYNCRRAAVQMQAWEMFLDNCKELRLLSDVPLPQRALVSKLEIQKLTESIQSLQKEPSVPSLPRSVSTGRQGRTGSLPLLVLSTARQPLHIHGPGHLQRISSQPMSQLPRRVPGSNREFPSIPEDVPYARHSSADLIDLSFDPNSSSHVDESSVPQTRSETDSRFESGFHSWATISNHSLPEILILRRCEELQFPEEPDQACRYTQVYSISVKNRSRKRLHYYHGRDPAWHQFRLQIPLLP